MEQLGNRLHSQSDAIKKLEAEVKDFQELVKKKTEEKDMLSSMVNAGDKMQVHLTSDNLELNEGDCYTIDDLVSAVARAESGRSDVEGFVDFFILSGWVGTGIVRRGNTV